MIQRLLVKSFGNSGKIVSMGRQSVTLRADYSLLMDLREFQAEFISGGTPRTRVQLNAKLVGLPQREIRATETFEFLKAATSPNQEAVGSAFDTVPGETIKRIVNWSPTSVPWLRRAKG